MTTTSTDKSPACLVCNAPMPEGASRCEACGATRGAHHKCPFCGAVAEPQPHPTLRFACPVCGAPRVPVPVAEQPPAEVVASLRAARSARASATVWNLAALLGATFGALSVLLLVGIALIASPSLLPLVAAATVASAPLLFALVAWRRSATMHTQVNQALDSAWLQAAHQFATTRSSVRAPQLAQALGIDSQQAQALLSKLSARDDVATEITDDGELALSVRYAPRMRIGDRTDAAPSDDPHPATQSEPADEPMAEDIAVPARKAGM